MLTNDKKPKFNIGDTVEANWAGGHTPPHKNHKLN